MIYILLVIANMMDQDEAMFGTEVKPKPKKKINLTKWFALGLGGVLGLSHVGMIGMISRKDGLPDLDIPVGPYTSYVVSADKEGYKISYTANDPKTAYITKDIKEKGGFLGLANNTQKVVEEYFMDGQINQGGAVSNHRSWLDGKPGLTQGEAAKITAARKSEAVSKQSEVQKVQADSWVHRLVRLLLLLSVLSPLLVGLLLVGWQCLVAIRVLT